MAEGGHNPDDFLSMETSSSGSDSLTSASSDVMDSEFWFGIEEFRDEWETPSLGDTFDRHQREPVPGTYAFGEKLRESLLNELARRKLIARAEKERMRGSAYHDHNTFFTSNAKRKRAIKGRKLNDETPPDVSEMSPTQPRESWGRSKSCIAIPQRETLNDPALGMPWTPASLPTPSVATRVVMSHPFITPLPSLPGAGASGHACSFMPPPARFMDEEVFPPSLTTDSLPTSGLNVDMTPRRPLRAIRGCGSRILTPPTPTSQPSQTPHQENIAMYTLTPTTGMPSRPAPPIVLSTIPLTIPSIQVHPPDSDSSPMASPVLHEGASGSSFLCPPATSMETAACSPMAQASGPWEGGSLGTGLPAQEPLPPRGRPILGARPPCQKQEPPMEEAEDTVGELSEIFKAKMNIR